MRPASRTASCLNPLKTGQYSDEENNISRVAAVFGLNPLKTGQYSDRAARGPHQAGAEVSIP